MKRLILLVCAAAACWEATSQAQGQNYPSWQWDLQYRVMYNRSNIGAEDPYDFFRQRLRLGVDVQTEAELGGYLQIEYRAVWGDAKGTYDPDNAPFNFLNARGIRYGYLYFPLPGGRFTAGLIPLNDYFGQTLFSADWDFIVGGIGYEGQLEKVQYRLAYVKFVEGFNAGTDRSRDEDQNLLISDIIAKPVPWLQVSLGAYDLRGKLCASEADCKQNIYSQQNQTWYGSNLGLIIGPSQLDLAYLTNNGTLGDTDTEGHMIRGEAKSRWGSFGLSVLGIMTTGNEDKDAASNNTGFQTIQGLKGIGGYWNYTYLFSPHGPSDVNDLGMEASNRGFGLLTYQAKVDFPIWQKLSGQIVAARFDSQQDMVTTDGVEVSKELGEEFGVQATYGIGKSMALELGYAQASLGKAGKNVYQKTKESRVVENFARLQLEF